MAAASSLNAASLTMKLSTKPGRRLSISFDSVRDPSRDLFPRSDHDSLGCELAEIFSLVETVELVNGYRIIRKMGWEGDAATLSKSPSVFKLLLQELDESDQNRRCSAATLLCVFMVGMAGNESQSETDKINDGALISQTLIQLGILPAVINCLSRSVLSMLKLQFSESDAQSMDTFFVTSRELRFCFSILLICAISLPNNSQVKKMLSQNMFDDKHVSTFCLDLVACHNADLFPLKKILILIRHAFLNAGCDLKASEFGEEYVKKVKSRRRDVFHLSKHIAEHFGPILCIPNSAHLNGIELVTFSRTPAALVQQIETARKFMHNGYSDTDHLFFEELPQSDATSTSDKCQMLYRILYPRLREYVVAILKIFLSIAPNVRPSAQITNSFRELHLSAVIPDLSNSIERPRHTEILTKNIAYLLLCLLKTFRKGHPLQFTTLLCLLQDKNCLILILKFLNQNLSASLLKRNEIAALSIFGSALLSLDDANIIGRIANGKGSLNEPCWRKYSAYVNMLRILQKITKNSPRQIRSLLKFRSPEILIRLLELPQSDIIIYTLKLLKNQVGFTDVKWRAENVDIITAIFMHIRMDLFDNWLEPKLSTESILEAENSVAKSIRQCCHIFNSFNNQDASRPLLLPENTSDRPNMGVIDHYICQV